MYRKYLWALLILSGLVIGGIILSHSENRTVCACGGFFSADALIDQNAERIIFTMNADDTITAIVGINYVGEAEDFSWIVPVPAPPELDVAETESLNLLDVRTQVGIREPDFTCGAQMPNFYAGMGGMGGGPSIVEGDVGPYEYTIIGSEYSTEMVTWLRTNGYRVTAEMEPLISVYVEEGMYFLAMRLQQNATVDDIQPIVMTYPAKTPTIPLRLTAVAAVESMPVIVWIFADIQYAPSNYAHAQVDFAEFQSTKSVRTVGYYTEFFDYDPNVDYPLMRDAIQARYHGQAFITEYAQPSQNLLVNPIGNEGWRYNFNLTENDYTAIANDPLLTQLVAEHPYVTRLYAQLSPDQMILDPTFMPAPDEADVDNLVELSDYVDPLAYYGCSTRASLMNGDQSANLPDGLTRLENHQFTVAHPANWILSEITVPFEGVNVFDEDLPNYQHAYFDGVPVNAPDELPIWILAPEPVDETTLAAYFNGEDTPPMFVISEMAGWIDWERFGAIHDGLGQEALLLARLGQDFSQTLPGSPQNQVAGVRYDITENAPDYGGLVFGMLANEDDWAKNGALYATMLDFAQSFQYYKSADWQHTLFLPVYYEAYSMRWAFAYPTGWYEQANADWEITLTPTPFTADTDREDLPYVRLIPMQRFENDAKAAGHDFALEIHLYYAIDWMLNAYQLESPYEWDLILSPTAELLESNPEIFDVCFMLENMQFDFSANGRRGQAALTQAFVVEWSVPENWEGDTAELESMFDRAVQDITETTLYGLNCNDIPFTTDPNGYILE